MDEIDTTQKSKDIEDILGVREADLLEMSTPPSGQSSAFATLTRGIS